MALLKFSQNFGKIFVDPISLCFISCDDFFDDDHVFDIFSLKHFLLTSHYTCLIFLILKSVHMEYICLLSFHCFPVFHIKRVACIFCPLTLSSVLKVARQKLA